MPSMYDADKFQNFLDQRVEQYNQPAFVQDDPVSVPHQFRKKHDIEIAGFFAATFAWGIRKTIINKCNTLLELMDNAPYEFCLYHSERDLLRLQHFVHRTFNGDDLLYFIEFLKQHYQKHNSLEVAFFNKETLKSPDIIESSLDYFYEYFFSLPYVIERTRKHIAAPKKKSACKRLNMFLRWMVRNDHKGVDLGIWKRVTPADLIIPLDVHVARVARNLKLLSRKQTDWKAAVELTESLKSFDAADPVKYDFALFGLGIVEKY